MATPPLPPGFVLENPQIDVPLEINIVGGRPERAATMPPPPPPGFVLDDSAQASVPTTAMTVGEQPLTNMQGLGAGLRSVLQGAGGLVGAIGGDAVNQYLIPGDQLSYRDAASALADKLGLSKPQTSSERVMGDIGEALTGTGLTMGIGGALNAGRAVVSQPSMQAAAADFLTANPVLQGVSAATGAGAGATARESGAGVGGQLAAALAGGLAPGALSTLAPMVTRGILRGGEGNRQALDKAIKDFQVLGATPSVGQGTGAFTRQGAESLLAAGPTSAGVISRFAERQSEQLGKGLSDIAGKLSRNPSSERAGRAVEEGIRGQGGFMENFRNRAAQLYQRLDQTIPADQPVPVANALGYLAAQATPIPGAASTSQLLSNPKLAQIGKALQDDVASGNGAIPYEALSRLRTQVGEAINDAGLISDQPTRQLKQLYGALTSDMKEAAQAAGPEAKQAFSRANSYYAAGTKRIDAIERIIDRNGGPEKIFAAVMGGTKDGGTTLRAVMQSLPEEGQKAVTAAALRRMGMANPGAQDAAGEAFSASTFLTNWNKVSPEARRAMFDRYGPGFSKDMDKIAAVSERIKNSASTLANASGTGAKTAGLGYYGGLTGSLLTGNLGTTAALLGTGAAANVAARLMTSPRVVRWLAKATDLPAGALPAQIGVLNRIAANTGDQDVKEFADLLQRSAEDPVSQPKDGN